MRYRLALLLAAPGLWVAWPAAAGPIDLLKALAPYQQDLEAAAYLQLLDQPREAQRLLATSVFVKDAAGRYQVDAIVRKKPTEPAVMFRLVARDLRGRDLLVLFKPRQSGYSDWATEIAACRLARLLGVAVAPCHERTVPYRVLAAVLKRLPAQHRQRLVWSGEGKTRQIYGFFRLWAPQYKNRIGRLAPSEDNLWRLVAVLQPSYRDAVRRSAVLKRVSDLIVFDYLIGNNDRRNNLGAIRGPTGTVLFPIDFGDGMRRHADEKRFYRRLFGRLQLFRRQLIDNIRHRLSARAMAKVVEGLAPIVAQPSLDALKRRRQLLLERIGKLQRRHGAKLFF